MISPPIRTGLTRNFGSEGGGRIFQRRTQYHDVAALLRELQDVLVNREPLLEWPVSPPVPLLDLLPEPAFVLWVPVCELFFVKGGHLEQKIRRTC